MKCVEISVTRLSKVKRDCKTFDRSANARAFARAKEQVDQIREQRHRCRIEQNAEDVSPRFGSLVVSEISLLQRSRLFRHRGGKQPAQYAIHFGKRLHDQTSMGNERADVALKRWFGWLADQAVQGGGHAPARSACGLRTNRSMAFASTDLRRHG